MKKAKILFVCGAGLGSSFAAQMATEDVLNAMRVSADLEHCDISSAVSMKADIIVTAENFRTQFDKFTLDEHTDLIFLRNIVSKDEIIEKITPVLKKKGIL